MAEKATLAPAPRDALLALAFLAVGWVSSGAPVTTGPFFQYTPRDSLFHVLLLVATAPYAWRQRSPAVPFVLAVVSTTGLWALGYNTGTLPMLLLVGAYLMAITCPPRVVTAGAAVALSCFVVLWVTGAGAPYGTVEAVSSAVAVCTSVALGRATRLRVDLAEARTRATEEAARRRATEERLRIARELHDILGHSLGTIAVQAGVGRHLMSGDPQRAADALDEIARVSRSALDEVRTAVATLRDGEADYHPTAGLADVPDLVQTARRTGLSVDLALPDDLDAVPRQASAAVYRIVREALTNVVRHAHASAASVEVRHHDGRLEVAVRDDGPPVAPVGGAHAGYGIRGMRERAEALGGNLTAGPSATGGFAVTASLPVSPERPR